MYNSCMLPSDKSETCLYGPAFAVARCVASTAGAFGEFGSWAAIVAWVSGRISRASAWKQVRGKPTGSELARS